MTGEITTTTILDDKEDDDDGDVRNQVVDFDDDCVHDYGGGDGLLCSIILGLTIFVVVSKSHALKVWQKLISLVFCTLFNYNFRRKVELLGEVTEATTRVGIERVFTSRMRDFLQSR